MGPNYACLFVGYVEEKMLLTYHGTNLIMLGRYDNYIGISTSTKKELKDFIQYVNDFHPSLNHTYEISDTSVNIYDISISMTKHGLTTNIFTKKLMPIHISDMNQLIHHLVKKVFIIHSF